MFCTECGTELEEDSLFCPQCGSRIAYPQPEEERKLTVEEPAGEPEEERKPAMEEPAGELEAEQKPAMEEPAGAPEPEAPPEMQTGEIPPVEDRMEAPAKRVLAGQIPEAQAPEAQAEQARTEQVPTGQAQAGTGQTRTEQAQAGIGQAQTEKAPPAKTAPAQKNRRVSIALILVLVLLLVAAGGAGGYLLYRHTNKWQHWVSDYQNSMQEYYLSDEEKKDYEDYLQDASEARNEADREALKAEMESLRQMVQEENEAYLAELDENKAKVEANADLTYAMPAEIEAINQSKAKYEELIQNRQYPDAVAETENCMRLEEEAARIREGWQVELHQMDVSNYPNIKLYFTVEDEEGNAIEKLQKDSFFLSQKQGEGYVLHAITNAIQLNENENLNINLIADVSGSMDGNMDAVKSVMNRFLDTVQFDVGDQVGLIAFDDISYYLQDFISDKQALSSSINSMELGGMTKLYDTLIEGVQRVLPQTGAKCVIAFTDGYDNRSASTAQEVIDYANTYQIPIFIIGIGSDVDAPVLREIAESTGGFYEAVDYVDDSFEDIYAEIYCAQKEVYCLEYTVDGDNMCDTQDISVYIRDTDNGGTVQAQYTAAEDYFGILLQQYLTSYVEALEAGDYAVMEQAGYLKPDGGIAKEMKAYIKKNEETLSEQLLSCEVTEIQYQDADTYIMTTEEVYDIQQERNFVEQMMESEQDDEKAAIRFMEEDGYDMEYLEEEDVNVSIHKMRRLQGQYVIQRNGEGKWQFADYKDSYEVLESEVYTAYPLYD